MSRDGLRIEAAASVVARDMITKHMAQFGRHVKNNKITGQAVVAAYIDGLSGAVALVVAGRQGFKTEVIEATVQKLRDAIERDLRHLS